MQIIEIPLVDKLNLQQAESSLKKGNAKRIGISTLGCKVNSYESELIGELLKTQSWQTVPSNEVADLYLINTCTVTKEADRQARQVVRKAIKTNPEALVVVTGCYAQMDAQACAAIPGVDLVLGNDQKLDLHKLLPELEQGSLPKVLVGDLNQHVSLPEQLLTGYETHTRAFVQIQQGCDQGCTFCIIHRARGPSRSLSTELIKRQIQRLVLNGYPEIVICGVDLGSYGQDLNKTDYDLVGLLEDILQLDCDQDNPFRIRLSSIDPTHISDELIELMASEDRLCPHIHLSLQSGSDLILKRMKRRYGAQHVTERIAKFRQLIPELVLSADVMVGFPTESEEHYLQTENLVKELNIIFPHVFTYSEREGTPAARIPATKQVPVPLRKERNKRLRELGAELKQILYQQRLGQHAWVLPENSKRSDEHILARSEDYLPVIVKSGDLIAGKWQKVEYVALENNNLIGVPTL